MGEEAAAYGPNNQTGPNMVYVANSEQGDYANAALSVYWDSIHGDHVTPRPILTYNPEALDDPAFTVQDKKLPASLRKKLKGEVSHGHAEPLHLRTYHSRPTHLTIPPTSSRHPAAPQNPASLSRSSEPSSSTPTSPTLKIT